MSTEMKMSDPSLSPARRRRRSISPWVLASRIPKVIPPQSWVFLKSVDRDSTPDWVDDRGRVFRVGYYNRQDGLDCIWLVNEKGEYEQTTDRKTLLDHFLILLSNERDVFGDARSPLKPVKTGRTSAFAIPETTR